MQTISVRLPRRTYTKFKEELEHSHYAGFTDFFRSAIREFLKEGKAQ